MFARFALLAAGFWVTPVTLAQQNPWPMFGANLPFATAGAPSFAEKHRHKDGAHPRPEELMEQFSAELGLTGQQRMDIQIITADYQTRLSDLAGIARNIAAELLEIAPDADDYIAKSDAASAQAAAVTAESVTLLAEMRGKLYSVLTPDQRQRLQQLADDRKAEAHAKIEAKKAERGNNAP